MLGLGPLNGLETHWLWSNNAMLLQATPVWCQQISCPAGQSPLLPSTGFRPAMEVLPKVYLLLLTS